MAVREEPGVGRVLCPKTLGESLGFTSPASGREWTLKYLLDKFRQRSVVEAEFDLSYKKELETVFGDEDGLMTICLTKSSYWNQQLSPAVRLTAVLPVHFTVNSALTFGWKSEDQGGVKLEKASSAFLKIEVLPTEKSAGLLVSPVTTDELLNEVFSGIIMPQIQHLKNQMLRAYLPKTE